MLVEVDALNQVILLLDAELQVRDAFLARGITRHECPYPVRFYTYRSLLTPAGSCAVCGYPLDRIAEPCSSSGGFHAFVGVAEIDEIPAQHKVENRSLDLLTLRYDEFAFFCERDNLFPLPGADAPFEV